jgi:molybdate transport system substrate-binding protein
VRKRFGAFGVVLVVATGMLSACGSSSSPGESSGAGTPASPKTTLTVLGAASLTKVFPIIGDQFSAANPGVAFRFTFAGTDALAAQIEQGAPADVFAGASTKYGDQLSGESLIDSPTPFCTNTLVLIVPSNNPAGITTLQDLTKSGIKLVIGAETVPIGAYTRTVLTNLNATYGASYSDDVLKNVVSEEDSVTSIVAKVQLGEADAGFVYVTDALAAGSKVNSIDIPASGQATATYPIAVVKATKDASLSQKFVDYVLSPPAQAELKKAGFGPPPSP